MVYRLVRWALVYKYLKFLWDLHVSENVKRIPLEYTLEGIDLGHPIRYWDFD